MKKSARRPSKGVVALKLRELRGFVARNAELAAEKGLTEADVSRLVAELRAERAGQ